MIQPMEETSKIIKAAIDPGNGYVKAARLDNGQAAVAMLPSIVGVGDTNLGLVAEGMKRKKRDLPRAVKIGGTTYLVGENVKEYAAVVERLDPGRFVGGPELRALTYASLADILEPGESDVGLVVGLPVEILQADDAKRTRRDLRKWLVKEHKFWVGEDFFKVRVGQVQVVSQPLGTYWLWGTNEQGVWVRDPLDLDAAVAVLDIGFGSLDLFVVENGKVTPRWTKGRDRGMRRACVLLLDLVYQAHGRELDMHEADALIRKTLTGKGPIISVPGGPVNVAGLVGTAIEMAQGEAIAFLNQQWGRGGQFAYVLFTGGGSVAYQPALAKLYPFGTLMESAETANVRGLAQLALRRGILKG